VIAATDYPLLGIFETMLIIFLWVAWIWLLIMVFSDLFRRRDLSGWTKALWAFFLIVAPFLGVFVYIIAQGSGMTARRMQDEADAQQQFDTYVKSVAASTGGSADQIAKAKSLLDDGVISPQEFDRLKQSALGAS
jgi:hypothetical protein